MGSQWTLLAGRIIATLWAAWWLFFALASAGVDSDWRKGIVPVTSAVLLVTVPMLLAWKWPVIGGPVLILEALLFIAAVYPIHFFRYQLDSKLVFVLATLPLPAIVSGALILASARPKPHPA